jgi:cytochrome c551/c552
MTHRVRTVSLALALTTSALPLAAQASMNLALDKGCLSCHGTPPRGKAPTIADLATRFASVKGNEAEMLKLSERLREHHLFGGVPAHERLSAEEAERFVRWLVDGGH